LDYNFSTIKFYSFERQVVFMSSKDFLKRMKEQAEEAGYSGGGGGTVAKILIELGLHRYVTGHDFWAFFKPLGDGDNEMIRVGEELSARLQAAGCSDKPQLGLKITIFKDALGRDPFKTDLQEFIPDWQDGFELVTDAIETLDLPFGKVFYGRFQYKSNPHFVKKGDAGKTEIDQNGKSRFPSIRLPIEKFTSEAEAQAAVGNSSANFASQWSDQLRANHIDPDANFLRDNQSDIQKTYDLMVKTKEKPYSGAPDLPDGLLTLPKIKQYLGHPHMWNCTSEDIDIVLSATPF